MFIQNTIICSIPLVQQYTTACYNTLTVLLLCCCITGGAGAYGEGAGGYALYPPGPYWPGSF